MARCARATSPGGCANADAAAPRVDCGSEPPRRQWQTKTEWAR
jgi:hypothetical protein